MNYFRTSQLFRIATVLVAMIGWFALSNRCALAQWASAPSAAGMQHSCCASESEQPCHSTPDAPSSNECCQKPHLVIPSDVKAPAPVEALLPLETRMAWQIVTALPIKPVQAAVNLGPPPEAPAFVELVLHRSLRSHAPPRLS